MGTLPVATAELIGTFLEAIFYGIYLVIFPRCLQVLRKKRVNTWLMVYFLATMFASFVLITMHICVDLTRAMMAFTANMDVASAPETFYANVDTRLNMLKNSTYVTTTLIADMVIVFRTFIIWGRNYWIVLVPTLLFGADIAMSAWFTWSVNEAKPGASVLISNVFARSKYFYICTLALNLLCTVLIAYKIWSIQRRVLNQYYGRLPNALSIVVESAAIYSCLLIVLIGTSIADSASMFFLLNSISPVIGSVFSYVILRSSSTSSRYNSETSVKVASALQFAAGSAASADMSHARSGKNTARMDGVEIHLEQIVHTDEESHHMIHMIAAVCTTM
ncbi:unnamed protein product [Somion occarium]|uniref:Uncharacterized protein n=1 Tax=Somion occarium TaxID=3059160 RepID=A0ABP1DKB4_9APHY